MIRERLDAYERQTRPVMEYFRESGPRLVEVDASDETPEDGVRRRFVRLIGSGMIVRKTAAELEKMRRSGLLVWQILQKLERDGHRGRQHARTWKWRPRR